MSNKPDETELNVAMKEFLLNPNCLDAINSSRKKGMKLEDIKVALERAITTVLNENPLAKQKLEELQKGHSELQKLRR